MLNGLFDILDRIIGFFGILYDRGYLFYLLLVAGILMLFTIGMFIYFSFVYHPDDEIPIPQKAIIDSAVSFCNTRGYDTWSWVNKTNLTFTCLHTDNQTPDLTDKYIENSSVVT